MKETTGAPLLAAILLSWAASAATQASPFIVDAAIGDRDCDPGDGILAQGTSARCPGESLPLTDALCVEWIARHGPLVPGGGADTPAATFGTDIFLVIGEFGLVSSRALVVDVAAGRSRPAAPLAHARSRAVVLSLGEGRVLVAGGSDEEGKPVGSVEIYDAASDVWAEWALFDPATHDPALATLSDGRVLLAGGQTHSGGASAQALLLDPATGSSTGLPPMARGRAGHATLLLRDGRVLVYGTSDASLEIFDPVAGSWTLHEIRPAPPGPLPWPGLCSAAETRGEVLFMSTPTDVPEHWGGVELREAYAPAREASLLWRFDLASGDWRAGPPTLAARNCAALILGATPAGESWEWMRHPTRLALLGDAGIGPTATLPAQQWRVADMGADSITLLSPEMMATYEIATGTVNVSPVRELSLEGNRGEEAEEALPDSHCAADVVQEAELAGGRVVLLYDMTVRESCLHFRAPGADEWIPLPGPGEIGHAGRFAQIDDRTLFISNGFQAWSIRFLGRLSE